MVCRGITAIIDQWNCNAGVLAELFPTHHQPTRYDILLISIYYQCDCSSAIFFAFFGSSFLHCGLLCHSEGVNANAKEEGTEKCPICQDRLSTYFELGRMIPATTTNGCHCTARYHYSCLQWYRNHESSHDQEQNRVKCMMCNRISMAIDRIWC